MFGMEGLGVNDRGHLTLGGMDVPALAKKYGTPLLIMDEAVIRRAAAAYREALRRHYGENSLAAYASKAFCTMGMYRILQSEGLGADVVSGGEIYTARAAGFDMENTFFHGNNKTPEELQLALEAGVGRFVVDNLDEAARLDAAAGALGRRARVLLRVKPGIEAHTHEYVRTGQIDSKFGVAVETGEALEAVRAIYQYPNLEFMGVHCHIGSQILVTEPYAQAADVMTDFMAALRDTLGAETRELNVGGGFGVRYLSGDEPKSEEENIEVLAQALKAALARKKLPAPKLIIEPGRSIAAPAGISVYTVGSVKTIPGVRRYVAVDGGMTDNPRYALYRAKYEFLLPEYADQPRSEIVTIAGRCCESGDLLGEGVPLQPVRAGDLLCTLTTGAYCYAMASNYNRVPRPAVVMVYEGKDRLLVRRESYEDLIRNDVG